MCTLRALLFFLFVPACLEAQPAPTVATTIVTTDTTATSICAGGNTIKAPSTCLGGMKSKNIFVSGVADNTGIEIQAVTTMRPVLSFENASTGLLATIQATNTKDLYLYGNGASAFVTALFSTGGMSVGDTTDPGDNNLRIAGTTRSVGNLSTDGDLTAVGNLSAGTTRIQFSSSATDTTGLLSGFAFGTGNRPGATLQVGRNTSGSGAAGTLSHVNLSGSAYYLWPDTAGLYRISTAPPQEDGSPADNSGTVVGDQTSTLDTKDVLGPGVSPSDALATMLRTPTFRFTYRSGAYSGTVFEGIAADLSPEFAMDPDAAHPNGRSFNPVNALGYTVQAIKALQAEIDALRADVRRLRQEAP